MCGPRMPSVDCPAFARAWFSSAQMPAHVGLLQLVPPTTCLVPPSTITAPKSGSAEAATSGTSRELPLTTPWPDCHDGLLKKMLTPPPLAPLLVRSQTDSDETVLLLVRTSEVPPTPVTF